MADLLKQAGRWLETMRKAHLSSPVEYRRGNQAVTVLATIGRTVFEGVTDFGTQTFDSRDFLVAAADLALAGQVIEPAPGDLVTATDDDGIQRTYEVLAPGPNKCFSRGGTTLRIHTKEVASE